MTNAIEIAGLTKSFNEFSLKDIGFNVPKGYITGFIGPNGAGKTTTIKNILGMLLKDHGSVKVFGNEVSNQSLNYKENIGIVMDQTFYVKTWTIEDMEKAVSPFYFNWNSNIFKTYLDKFNLSAEKKISELSKGMKMKLMIAAALSHKAKLLILDEPTSGLDPVAREELMEILQEYISDEENTVFFSTHITADLDKIADFIVFIKDGSILFEGEKNDFKEAYCIVKDDQTKLTKEDRKLISGLKFHSTYFDGIIKSTDKNKLSKEYHLEKPSIDDIMIYLYRGKI